MSKIIMLVTFFIDTQPSIGFSDSQDKEIYEGTIKRIALLLVDAFLSLCCFELTLVCFSLLGLQVHHQQKEQNFHKMNALNYLLLMKCLGT